MKTNKEMYKNMMDARIMRNRYSHWEYIDNYKDMKREEKLYDEYCEIYETYKEMILNAKKYAKLTVYKDFPIYDLESGKLTGEVSHEEMQLYVIGKTCKDDIVLFVCGTHVYTAQEVQELGWKTQRVNGKIVYDDIY